MLYIIAGLGIVLLLAFEFFSSSSAAAPQPESRSLPGFDSTASVATSNLVMFGPISFETSVPLAPTTSPTSRTVRIAEAIARAEGFGVPGAIPTRANNPGDLVLGDIGNGTLGAGITVFPDAQSGWNALYNQVNLILSGLSSVYSPDMTIAQIAAKWTATQQSAWASNVAAALGVTPDTVIANA